VLVRPSSVLKSAASSTAAAGQPKLWKPWETSPRSQEKAKECEEENDLVDLQPVGQKNYQQEYDQWLRTNSALSLRGGSSEDEEEGSGLEADLERWLAKNGGEGLDHASQEMAVGDEQGSNLTSEINR